VQDRIVGIELARGQAFQVQIGLELGVELLVGGVVLVERVDLLGVVRVERKRPTTPIDGR
jgi:hypothetical protein